MVPCSMGKIINFYIRPFEDDGLPYSHISVDFNRVKKCST